MKSSLPRTILAVGLGNALEFYDFLAFSFFAIQIGQTFFPSSATSHGLLFSLATYGIGFLTRPLGGAVFGWYGDRVGRKPAMIWSFGLMGAATLGFAVTPSYASIGVAAPVLMLFFRLMQGFSLGGEVGPSTAFLVEIAPPRRRGLYIALQGATQNVAVLAAGAVGLVLSNVLSPLQFDAWGWRVAFLIGVAVVPAGLYMRICLPETLKESDLPTTVKQSVPMRFIVLALMMLATLTITIYVIDYLTTYAQDTLRISPRLAFGVPIVEGLSVICGAPISGLLADRFGRKPVMLGGTMMLLISVLPCFIAVSAWRSTAALYGATAILSVLASSCGTPALTSIAESLPRSVRSAGFGTLYAIAIAVFGGSTQFSIKWLIDLTGNPNVPAWYLMVALVIGGGAMIVMHESAPRLVAGKLAIQHSSIKYG